VRDALNKEAESKGQTLLQVRVGLRCLCSERFGIVSTQNSLPRSPAVPSQVFLGMDQSSDANLAPAELKAGLRKLKVRMTEEQEEELVRFADKDGDGEINFNEFWLAMHVHVETEEEQEEDDLPLSTELQCQGVVLYRVNELHLPRLAGVHEDFGQPGFAIHTSEHWSELIQMRPWAGLALRHRLQV
jgi:hypothetical protein